MNDTFNLVSSLILSSFGDLFGHLGLTLSEWVQTTNNAFSTFIYNLVTFGGLADFLGDITLLGLLIGGSLGTVLIVNMLKWFITT